MTAGKSGIAALKQQTGIAPRTPQTLPEWLDAYKGEIARALPRHMSADRVTRIALTAFRQNPALSSCDPKSVFAAIIISSQLGLEIGVLGHAYLVPYKQECQLIPGWKGMVDLVNRAGKATVWTGAVYDGDEFDFRMGDSPFIRHKPCGEDDTDKLTHVYAVARIKGADFPIIEVWPMTRVIRHRNRYNKIGNKHYSFQHLEAYARKVVLLQVLKYAPVSIELAEAQELDYAAEKGSQKLTIEGAKAMQFEAAPELPQPTPFDEKFEILGWSAEKRAQFLGDMQSKTDEEINSVLEAELDKE